jgi:hypothetical protein
MVDIGVKEMAGNASYHSTRREEASSREDILAGEI